MPLYNRAFLQVESDAIGLATFEFSDGFEPTEGLTKSFVMGSRGQYIREIANQDLLGGLTGDADAGDRRTGYWIDGGAGDWEVQFAFETGLEAVRWGDGSGGEGPTNITRTDASGADVKAMTRQQVLSHVLAETRTDSLNPGRLHWGEWTDGDIDGESVDAGVYNQPMPVAVRETSVDNPTDDTSAISGTITVSHVAPFPEEIPEWIDNYLGQVENQLGDIPDA